jgi:ABC-type sugar transport system substrate-binding protein
MKGVEAVKRLTVAAGLLFCLASLLFFMRTSSSPQEPEAAPVVGYVDILSESSWRDRMSASIREAAQQRGIQLLTLECDRTQNAQIQALRSLITYQVDAIVFTPVVLSGWDNVLEEAKAANIPVILVERSIKTSEEDKVAAYIGSDYKLQGEQAALQLMAAFRSWEDTVEVVEMLGTVGASNTVQRSGGIRSLLSSDRKFNINYSVNCDFMFSKAKETFRIYLRNDRCPDALIAHSDAMALGAMEAMRELGLQPGRDIVIISFGGQQEAVDALEKGELFAIVETNPNVGPAVMDTVEALLRGESPGDVMMEEQVFTRESIPARGY